MFKRRVLTFIYVVCSWAGVTKLFYSLNRRRNLILTYHNIIPDDLFDDALHLGVSHRLSEFQRQLDLITARFQVTTEFLSDEPRSCVITFDDGYQNNVAAAECLERKGVRGVFFVPVDSAISQHTLVIDQVLRWFSYVAPGEYLVDGEYVKILDEKRREAYGNFYIWMLRNAELWEKIPKLLDACYPFAELKKLPVKYLKLRFQPMGCEELARLRAAGHRIGCHSYNHRPLAALPDAEIKADFEACGAHKELFNINAYSYPFGEADEVDNRVIQLCKSFGYSVAVSNIRQHGAGNPMALPRESLPQDANRYVLDAKLSGLEAFIKSIIHWL